LRATPHCAALIALLCAGALLGSGCATEAAMACATRREKPGRLHEALVAPDGSVAVKMDMVIYRRGGDFIESRELARRLRYAWLDGEAMRRALASPTIPRDGKASVLVRPTPDPADDGWRLVPAEFNAPDAGAADLPAPFREGATVCDDLQHVPYELDGTTISLRLSLSRRYRERRRTAWWLYPAYPLALACDLGLGAALVVGSCGSASFSYHYSVGN